MPILVRAIRIAICVSDAVNRVEQIADAARNLDVDLIVVSTHSRHWHPQLLFGKSVAENLLRHAPCPVLVVRNNK